MAGTPVGGPMQMGGGVRRKQVGGGAEGGATPMPIEFYNPIVANNCNNLFCGKPNNYVDYFYRGNCAKCKALESMNDEPFNPQGETLTGWQAPNAIPDGPVSAQLMRLRERPIVTPQGVVTRPFGQRGGGTFGAPFANQAFGCGPSPVSFDS